MTSISGPVLATTVHFSPQTQKNKVREQVGAASASSLPDPQDAADIDKIPGLRALLAQVEGDKDPKSMVSVITEVFDKKINEANAKVDALTDTQAAYQAALTDLNGLRNALKAYMDMHLGETGKIDFSDFQKVRLSIDSEMRETHKDGYATVEEVMNYYRENHAELALPENPTLIRSLKFYEESMATAAKFVSDFQKQANNLALQAAIQKRNTTIDMQSMILKAIFDAMKKFISGM